MGQPVTGVDSGLEDTLQNSLELTVVDLAQGKASGASGSVLALLCGSHGVSRDKVGSRRLGPRGRGRGRAFSLGEEWGAQFSSFGWKLCLPA